MILVGKEGIVHRKDCLRGMWPFSGRFTVFSPIALQRRSKSVSSTTMASAEPCEPQPPVLLWRTQLWWWVSRLLASSCSPWRVLFLPGQPCQGHEEQWKGSTRRCGHCFRNGNVWQGWHDCICDPNQWKNTCHRAVLCISDSSREQSEPQCAVVKAFARG